MSAALVWASCQIVDHNEFFIISRCSTMVMSKTHGTVIRHFNELEEELASFFDTFERFVCWKFVPQCHLGRLLIFITFVEDAFAIIVRGTRSRPNTIKITIVRTKMTWNLV
jgi:hypothetical protein